LYAASLLPDFQRPHSQSNTDSIRVKAASLLHSLKTSEFLVSLPIVNQVFALMKPLSEKLQAVNTDLFKTLANIRAVQTNLKNKRINSEAEFHRLFESAIKFAEFLDVDIKKPRTFQADHP